MPFGISPAPDDAPGFSVGAAPADPSSITVGPAPADIARPTTELYLQWRTSGVDLGDRRVKVVDIVGNPEFIRATRGVGATAHIVTIAFTPNPTYFTSTLYPLLVEEDLRALPAPAFVSSQEDVIDNLSATPTLVSVEVIGTFEEEDYIWPIEGLSAGNTVHQVEVITTYQEVNGEGPIDGMSAANTITGVEVTVTFQQIDYINWPIEGISTTPTITSVEVI